MCLASRRETFTPVPFSRWARSHLEGNIGIIMIIIITIIIIISIIIIICPIIALSWGFSFCCCSSQVWPPSLSAGNDDHDDHDDDDDNDDDDDDGNYHCYHYHILVRR